MNWCTTQNGKFELCVKELFPKSDSPPPVQTPTSSYSGGISSSGGTPAYGIGTRGSGDSGGLPGWAIALIVILCLLFLACLLFAIFSCFCRREKREKDEIHNNIYMNDRAPPPTDYRDESRKDIYYLEDGEANSAYNKKRSDDVQIVLAEPQNPKFDDDSFTFNTYESQPKPKSAVKKKRIGKDPTMYVEGDEDRPDPSTYMIEDGGVTGRRYYEEDPPVKPKREPTMYIDGLANGNGYRDPTMYIEEEYVDGESEYSVGRSGDVEQAVYDYENSVQFDAADYNIRDSRDPTYYEEESYRTQGVESSKADKSKKSKKSKSSRR